MVFCRGCGKEIHETAPSCPHCGAPQQVAGASTGPRSEKDYIIAILLCFFLGTFGVHRFYVGKVGTGLLMLVTLGGFGIWTLIDFIFIVLGSFTDSEGRKIKNG